MGKRMNLMAIGLVAVFVLASAPAAHAARADVVRQGHCSAQSTWKLKAKPDNGGMEVEFEVDQNVAGQVWDVAIQRNGSRIFSGSRTTQPPSGSFEVKRRVSKAAGSDRFVARATNASSGETCVGRVSS